MAKKKITDIIEEISRDFLEQSGLELYNSEFVKEGRDWFLRVYIDKTEAAAEAAKAAIAERAAREAAAAPSGQQPTGTPNAPEAASEAAQDAEATAGADTPAAAATAPNPEAAPSAAQAADPEAPLPTQYVSTDDCEKVSRFLSAELDRLDPIEQNYYLEVSSPGMDRALLKEKDFVRFAGEIVDISLYKAVDGRKAYQGRLIGMENEKIIITDEKENRIEFPREQVAKTKLAVIF